MKHEKPTELAGVAAAQREEEVMEIIMLMVQCFPIDFQSLRSLLSLSKSFIAKLNKNTLLWVALANRASKNCQACFLEARYCAQFTSSSVTQYWLDTVKILTSANSLRRQWGVRATHRTFINTGKTSRIMKESRKTHRESSSYAECNGIGAQLAANVRAWLSPMPSRMRNKHSHKSKQILRSSSTSSTCETLKEESEQELTDEEDSQEVETKPCAEIWNDENEGSSSISAERVIDSVFQSTTSRSVDSSDIKWEYCGHNIPKILDIYLQQEILSLTSPAALTSPPHAHCLECYPKDWQKFMLQSSPDTCYFAPEFDSWLRPNASTGSVICACRCSSWMEVDATCWLHGSSHTPAPGLSLFSLNRKRSTKLKYPYATWILMQLWRIAGGMAKESSSVRFFVTRITTKDTQTPAVAPGAVVDNSNISRLAMRVRRVSPVSHPTASLLLTAISFNRTGEMARVAGVCLGNKQELDDSFCKMFNLERDLLGTTLF